MKQNETTVLNSDNYTIARVMFTRGNKIHFAVIEKENGNGETFCGKDFLQYEVANSSQRETCERCSKLADSVVLDSEIEQ